MRRRYGYHPDPLSKRLEKTAIRILIALTVILVLFQIKTITDPVDFYLRLAGDIDAPAYKYNQYAEQNRKISLYLNCEPTGPVVVKQNDRILGLINDGLNVDVESGPVTLDASGIPYPLTVNIVYNEKNYQVLLNQEEKSFTVALKPKDSV